MEAENVKSLLARNVGITLSCLCAFFFQTSNAAMNHFVVSSVETLVGNVGQVKINTKENSVSANFKVKTTQMKYNRIHFALCKDCYWCASCLTDATKIVLCPSCQGSKLSSLPIFTRGLL